MYDLNHNTIEAFLPRSLKNAIKSMDNSSNIKYHRLGLGQEAQQYIQNIAV